MSQEDPKNPKSGNENQEDQSLIVGGSVKESPLHNKKYSSGTTEPINETNDNLDSVKLNLPVDKTQLDSKNQAKTSSGLDENIAALISYVGGFVTGLIFLFLERDNKYIRFHALQSIILTISWMIMKFILGFIPFIGWLFAFILNGLVLAIWIVCMVKAYQKQTFKIPIIGDLAEQYK